MKEILLQFEGQIVTMRQNDRQVTGWLWLHLSTHVAVVVGNPEIRPLIVNYQEANGLITLKTGAELFVWQDGVLVM